MLQTHTCLPLVAQCPTQCGQFLRILSAVLIIMAGLILSRLPQQNSNWNVKSVKQFHYSYAYHFLYLKNNKLYYK